MSAGTVDMGQVPPVYSLKLRKKTGRQSMLFTLEAPMPARIAPEVAEKHAFWTCRYSVRKGRKEVSHTAYGATWLDAFARAADGMRRMIPEDEAQEWVTLDGIESRRIFPRIVDGSARDEHPWSLQPAATAEDGMRQMGQTAPPVYTLKFRNRRKKAYLHFSMTMPEAVPQPVWTRTDKPCWRCTFTVTRRRKTMTKAAYGDDWPATIAIALDAMRRMIPDHEECDWETHEGVSSWCVFPKSVPIGWGHDFHRKLWDMVKAEDRKLQDEIEGRRLLHEKGLLPKGKLERAEAARIVDTVLALHAAIGTVDEAISDVKSVRHRRRMAYALGTMLNAAREDVLLPIFHDFPDLRPDGL